MNHHTTTPESLEDWDRNISRWKIFLILLWLVFGGALVTIGVFAACHRTKTDAPDVHCRQATYQGHRFLFLSLDHSTVDAGVVHDPNCPCRDKESFSNDN